MRNKAVAITLFAIAIGAIILRVPPTRITRPAQPNVVVILVDTLRADFLGLYGDEQPDPSPFLTELGESSTVFTRAFSTSSWTAPSTASLFTSLYPHHHGVVQGFLAHQLHVEALETEGRTAIQLNRLPETVTTLPERFRALGYTTHGMASNLNIGDAIGFTRGFDQFRYDEDAAIEDFYEELKRWKPVMAKHEPYFLYLHVNDVHVPYEPRDPYFDKHRPGNSFVKTLYLSEIAYVDSYLKRIYKLLGMDRDTVVVFVSDHGEEFMDHGGLEHPPQLYRELNQVMMMVHAPYLGVPAQRVDENVSLIDVYPTLMALLGEEMPHEPQGRSLAALVRPGDPARGPALQELKGRTLFAHRLAEDVPGHAHWAAIRQRWKYIEHWEKEPELYDHRDDLAERHSVLADNAAIVSEMNESLTAFRGTRPGHEIMQVDVEIDEEMMERLRSQGYVQ